MLQFFSLLSCRASIKAHDPKRYKWIKKHLRRCSYDASHWVNREELAEHESACRTQMGETFDHEENRQWAMEQARYMNA